MPRCDGVGGEWAVSDMAVAEGLWLMAGFDDCWRGMEPVAIWQMPAGLLWLNFMTLLE